MKKFNYKFETVSKVKDRLKTKAKKELAEIGVKIDLLKKKLDEFNSEVTSTKKSIALINYKAIEMQTMERHIIYMGKQIKSVLEEIEKLKVRKQKKLGELVERSKELKIFETLKEKHYEQHLFEQKKSELIMLDELAIQKSGRKIK